MDLVRHLGYFVAVAEEGHFGRAAARLHMAQPPLSQQIRRLESHLGVELFARTTRRVDLTDAGAAYLAQARAILAAIDTAADEARRVASGLIGRVRIGCVGSVTFSVLPQLSRQLAQDLPGVEFSFRGDLLSSDLAIALREREIDVALLRPPVLEKDLTVTSLRRDRLVAAVPIDHRLAQRRRLRVRDLAGTELIVHSASRRSRMFDVVHQLCRDAGFVPQVRHEVGETATLVTLVAGGRGIAVVPESVQSLRLDGVVYVPLTEPTSQVELVLAHRREPVAPHLERTITVLRAAIAT